MKQLLAQQELAFPSLFSSLLSAIKPIISIDKCQISIKSLSEYTLKLINQNPSLYNELIKSSDKDNDHDLDMDEDGVPVKL